MKLPFAKDRLLLLAFVLILLVFGGLIGRKYWIKTHPAEIPTVTDQAEPAGLRDVVLYFGDPAGVVLLAETREISGCQDGQACLEATLQALIDGPIGDLVPILPDQTRLLSITEQDGLATADFSRELISGHPGGSVSELFTAYGLVNTLAENFPYIRQLRILVEGEVVPSLKGHVDLRQPISADFRFTSQPEQALPVEQMLDAVEESMPLSEREQE
ncbi:MAG: GerMN domain-containing protein [Desulfuromonadaceae bacterium]|nr:GerMN domain-containing protein [Desulfuromonadaceae bacterium]